MKKCSKCGKRKSLKEFGKYWHKQAMTIFVRSRCRSCQLIYQAVWKSKNNDKQKIYRNKWIEKNLKKYKAHHALNWAIYSGKIKSKPCEICGKKAEAHHPDYDKPLLVIWLCPLHHKQRHREELAFGKKEN